jgi:predicted ATPase with chaperone activity
MSLIIDGGTSTADSQPAECRQRATGQQPSAPAASLPLLPKTVNDTGLSRLLLVELVAKSIFMYGRMHLPMLAARLKLAINVLNEVLGFMTAEHLAEIVRRGATDIDVEYQLTDAGKLRAAQFMERCRYIGPAPVTLAAYRAMTERQSVRFNRITRQQLQTAFADVLLNPELQDQVGAAMNSGRPLFLYGPAGSGKTYLAERLGRLMPGLVVLPYAIEVDNEIIQLFDPLVHEPVAVEAEQQTLDRRAHDSRWLLCKRPLVLTGGELTLDMLDLRYDRRAGFYQAPPHFKANNGLFIVDDLGRQQVAPHDLMNRWIVPFDRGYDQLSLHTGYHFTVPFDVAVVFSTNLQPQAIADEAFLRRLGYKIHVGALSREEYRAVFSRQARTLGIAYDEAAFRYLLDTLHRSSGRQLLACTPRDLLGQVVDYARYDGETPRMTAPALKRAWHTYFAADEAEAAVP